MKVKLLNIGIRFLKSIISLVGIIVFIILIIPTSISWILFNNDVMEYYLDFCDRIVIEEFSEKVD